ncbi:MAG: hypothetical protein RR744_09670 [Cellulosilyticaceae bacterium]
MNMPKNYIACNMEYFTLGKDVIIMKDNDIEHVKCESIDKLPKLLYNISKEKEIKEIIIGGERNIAFEIAEQIMSYEIHEFNKNDIQITIIQNQNQKEK